MAKHQNNGKCEKCKEIIERYPNFNPTLKSWFFLFQAKHPEAHVSCAGRGVADQMAALAAKASKASFGDSAHNWNCAIDVFVILPGKDIYDREWFKTVLAPAIPYFLNWYGAPGSPFPELPHIELREWRGLRAQGLCALVEPMPSKTDDVA